MKRELPGGESRRAVLFAWWKVLFVKMKAKTVGVTWIRVKILDFSLIRFIGGNFSGKLKLLL